MFQCAYAYDLIKSALRVREALRVCYKELSTRARVILLCDPHSPDIKINAVHPIALLGQLSGVVALPTSQVEDQCPRTYGEE